jgi:hypothetical protein
MSVLLTKSYIQVVIAIIALMAICQILQGEIVFTKQSMLLRQSLYRLLVMKFKFMQVTELAKHAHRTVVHKEITPYASQTIANGTKS